MNTSGNVQLQVGLNTNTTSYIASTSSPLSIFSSGVNDTQSRLNLNANVMNFTRGSSVGKPDIFINGSGDSNKYLIVNASGELDFSSSSVSGGVTSITAGGELSLSGAGTGDVTITHADSDHDDQYYTKTTMNTLLSAKENTGHGHNYGNSNLTTSDVTNNSAVQTGFNHANSGHVSNNSVNLAIQLHSGDANAHHSSKLCCST